MVNYKPETNFQDNLTEYSTAANQLVGQVQRWAWYRVLFFLGLLALLLYFANQRLGGWLLLTALVGMGIFIILVIRHSRLKHRRNLYQQLVRINQDELDRYHHQLAKLPDGLEFQHPFHPYSKDIDVFGSHSLFQYLNRTSSSGGARQLASYLNQPADISEIKKRQTAARELSPMLEWRQQFSAQGHLHTSSPADMPAFYQWLNSPNQVVNSTWAWIALATLPASSVVIILLASFQLLDWSWLWLPVLANALVLSQIVPKSRAAYKATEPALGTLRALAESALLIEAGSWSSDRLLSLQAQLKVSGQQPASSQIKLLSRILTGLESQNNAFYFLLNFLFLQDLYWLLRAERWRSLHHESVAHWFNALFEWEALNSLAGLAYAEPDWCWPELVEGEFCFQAQHMGHPLLARGRVTNDFELNGLGQTVLITGSNMAGKSTFLRTVAVTTVLALAGAPVCARQLRLSPLQLFTSMRTEDNLEESVSSFYAELQRLQQLLALLKAGDDLSPDLPLPPSAQTGLPVLYFLDEILKGTNSEDRHRGAAALIKQLQKLGASGLVSTHDLELGQTAAARGIQNYSFNSVVEGQQIHFNYKLEPGICQSFNATALMKKMGIEV